MKERSFRRESITENGKAGFADDKHIHQRETTDNRMSGKNRESQRVRMKLKARPQAREGEKESSVRPPTTRHI